MVDALKKEGIVSPVKEAVTTPEVKEDILSRVSRQEVVKPASVEIDPVAEVNDALSKIQDPVARQILQEKLKNIDKGVGQRFNAINQKELALLERERTLNSEMAKLNLGWTPERLKQEISKQDFIQSAQSLQSSQPPEGAPVTQEQWSYLTPEERAQIMQPIEQLKREVGELKGLNQSVMRDKIDTAMKTKYEDYDPRMIDGFLGQVNNRQVTDDQLIEMSYKALNYDRNVNRAYQLGKEGRSQEIGEKQNASSYSVSSGNTTPQSEPPKREASESASTFFRRIADWRKSHS